MLIWLTTPCIQPYCIFNQVIKRAIISLMHPLTDHCSTLVIDKRGTRVLLQKLCIMLSTATTFYFLSTCKNVIVLNSLVQQPFHLCTEGLSIQSKNDSFCLFLIVKKRKKGERIKKCIWLFYFVIFKGLLRERLTNNNQPGNFSIPCSKSDLTTLKSTMLQVSVFCICWPV